MKSLDIGRNEPCSKKLDTVMSKSMNRGTVRAWNNSADISSAHFIAGLSCRRQNMLLLPAQDRCTGAIKTAA